MHQVTTHTFLLALLHLLVDGVCASGVMIISRQLINDVEADGIIVLYDLLAFGTQPLTGRWMDSRGVHPFGFKLAMVLLICGALLCSLSTSIIRTAALVGTILLGMGNSCFHVYGGKYVAVVSHNDIRALGVFVSTGAVGLAIGIGFSSRMLLAAFLLVLLVLSALHLYNADKQMTDMTTGSCCLVCKEARQTSTQPLSPVLLLYLTCLMLVVAGRACIGESVPSLRISISSMSPSVTMVVVSVIVMVGKAIGGFLSKRWGVRNVFTASMLIGATFFLMSPWHDIYVIGTLFLFNLTMPCTLYLAYKIVPRREGWAFGLLAMALLPGFLLGYLLKDNATYQALLSFLMATIILESFLLLCMRECRWQVLATSVVLNILTNVPLNAFMRSFGVYDPLNVIGLECLVVAVEFIGYWLVLHDRKRAFKYSLMCNLFSALIGCFFQLLF